MDPFTQLTKAAEDQKKRIAQSKGGPTPPSPKDKEGELEKDPDDVISQTDIGISHTDINLERFTKIISAISATRNDGTESLVRYTVKEQEIIEDFISKHRKSFKGAGINLKGMSASKMFRYAIAYLITYHEVEFIKALEAGLSRDTNF
jgi:hypothetical protein